LPLRPRSSAGGERGPDDPRSRFVYWHRDLPPLDGEILDEHVLEAKSDRVAGSIERIGDLWARCHAMLMEHATARLAQEVARLGGDYAHVLDEHIDGRRDDLTNESWLEGRFNYVLYRRGDRV
jgi:hypothetical protein